MYFKQTGVIMQCFKTPKVVWIWIFREFHPLYNFSPFLLHFQTHKTNQVILFEDEF